MLLLSSRGKCCKVPFPRAQQPYKCRSWTGNVSIMVAIKTHSYHLATLPALSLIELYYINIQQIQVLIYVFYVACLRFDLILYIWVDWIYYTGSYHSCFTSLDSVYLYCGLGVQKCTYVACLKIWHMPFLLHFSTLEDIWIM